MTQELDDRKRAEATFHDELRHEQPWQRYSTDAEQAVAHDPNWANFKFYSIERQSRAYTDTWLRDRCNGKIVLDYACGNGDDAIFAAKLGATAVGIDISPVSIEHAREKAKSEGVSSSTEFHVMDAEALDFPANTFDIGVIYGVLHHLDFERAMAELSRVMKPNGQIIATEALNHNPLIRAYRRRTPHLRTSWEVDHILTKPTIELARKYFNRVSCRFFHLATVAAVPFRNTPLFNPVLSVLEGVDSLLLSVPGLKWHAWQAVIELSEPKR